MAFLSLVSRKAALKSVYSAAIRSVRGHQAHAVCLEPRQGFARQRVADGALDPRHVEAEGLGQRGLRVEVHEEGV